MEAVMKEKKIWADAFISDQIRGHSELSQVKIWNTE